MQNISNQNINHYLLPGGTSLEQSQGDLHLSANKDDNDLVIAQLINEMNNIKEVSTYSYFL
jgi:hypothetical protein